MELRWIVDEEGQDFVLSNDWDTIIPISFLQIGDTLTLSVFPDVETEMRAHFDKYQEKPFSKEALSAMWDALAPFMAKWGYGDDRFRDRWGYVYRLYSQNELTLTPFSSTRRLVAEDEDKNQTTFDIEMSCDEGLLGYGTFENDQVVSLAMTHEPVDPPPAIIEVGVETIPSARGKGLASSNLSALSADLLSRGFTVEYRCQRYNHASRHVAERTGMKQVGRYYYYVGRKLSYGI